MNKIDLTGKRFGKLVVLEEAKPYIQPNGRKRLQWLCQCDCGNQKIILGDNLRGKKTESCGCLKKQKGLERLVDLTGQKFGRLTVIKLHHKNESTNHYYWECQCDCGGNAIVYGGHLKDGHTKSCGCLISNGEEKIASLLKENNINFKKQYTFDDCRGINNGKLRFDFGILKDNGELDYLIEYDGWQHKIKTNSKWDRDSRFENRITHDEIKNKYCEDNNIRLIRINSSQYKNLSIEDLV